MAAVGIDISSNIITLVEIARSRKGTTIKNAAGFEISQESITKGELQDPVAFSLGLKDAWRKNKFSGRNVFVGLSNLKAIVREVELPLVNKEEISNSLKYQINDFIPIPKDNILYDFYIMEQSESSSKLMLVGAMKSMINNVIEAVKGAGLITDVIDLNCFSLFRTIDRLYDLKKNKETNCAVYIGADVSIIEVIQDDTLKFPRFLSNSISTFVDNMEKSTGIDEQEARKFLQKFDFQSLTAGKSPASGEMKEKVDDKKSDSDDISTQEENMVKSISSTADNFISEIRMSIEHFLQEDPKAKIGKILLAGENLKNIGKYIQFKTDYNVEELNVSKSFPVELINKGSDIGKILDPLAIGMALRGIQ
jgi:type IV pilus assembly protein PilM